MKETVEKVFKLMNAKGQIVESSTPGTLGGTRRGKLYGRLDCRSAKEAIARGGYVENRVFFADEATAIAAGYRPCHTCMRAEYDEWVATQKN